LKITIENTFIISVLMKFVPGRSYQATSTIGELCDRTLIEKSRSSTSHCC